MKSRIYTGIVGVAALMLFSIPPGSVIIVRAQTATPNIAAQLSLATQEVHRGRVVRASLVLTIPAGYHVNAHNPISRFALPTRIEVEAPSGIKIGAITYPKAIVRRFKFSADRLGVYERSAVIRFNLVVPPDQATGAGQLKVRLSYQSCSNEVCFPPAKREIAMPITVCN
jgi:DsbC/DsbD-like thiol-disulfide interchange protein